MRQADKHGDSGISVGVAQLRRAYRCHCVKATLRLSQEAFGTRIQPCGDPASGRLLPLHLNAWIEAPLVLAGIIAGCWALHEFVIRRSAVLRPCFGFKPLPAAELGTQVATA